MTDESSTAERLAFEHSKAIYELSLKKEKWVQLKKEYTELKGTVINLPNKLAHDVMVPIGSVGMFQGQLVHTNEITVLLGDNWFAQCTASQAGEIIDRRIKMVEKNLEEMIGEIRFLESRRKVTEDLTAMDKDQGVVEIREESKEELPEPAGKRRIAHKSSHNVIPRGVKDLDKAAESNSGPSNASVEKDASLEKLFARLDELELEETASELKENNVVVDGLTPSQEARVRFREDLMEDYDAPESLPPDTEVRSESNCIRFKHTRCEDSPAIETSKDANSDESSGIAQKFVSPADIYKYFAKPLVADAEEKPLKSILKKERRYSSEGVKPKPILKHSPEHKSDGSSGDELGASAAAEDPKPILKAGSDAISGKVVERQVNSLPEKPDSGPEPRKSMSRFKASRMKK